MNNQAGKGDRPRPFNRKNWEKGWERLSMQCKFEQDWMGRCENRTNLSRFCSEHKKVKCKVCNKQATHTCSIASSLVCGTPLCDNCGCPIHG